MQFDFFSADHKRWFSFDVAVESVGLGAGGRLRLVSANVVGYRKIADGPLLTPQNEDDRAVVNEWFGNELRESASLRKRLWDRVRAEAIAKAQ